MRKSPSGSENGSNDKAPAPSSSPNTGKRMLLALVGVFLVHSLLHLEVDPCNLTASLQATSSQQQSVVTQPIIANSGNRSLAREIVERAYKQTYKHLVDRCDQNTSLLSCMTTIHNEKTEYAWWFETMLRDGGPGKTGMHGGWHNNVFQTPKHRVQFCNIEKTASSEWKGLDELLCKSENKTKKCHAEESAPEDPRAVFLRDPLEKFLSGFIDKCYQTYTRHGEDHCQPLEVYSPGILEQRRDPTKDSKKQPVSHLVQELETSKKVFFEAYTDTMPLKWNVHFFPSALYCNGLFRTIKDYDFVGHMGPDFRDNLREFGHRYDIVEQVEKVFKLPPLNVTATDEVVFQKKHKVRRTGSASKKIKEFYTPRSLRRALQYFSIDYGVNGLNMPIPDWVDEMLKEEDQEEEEGEVQERLSSSSVFY